MNLYVYSDESGVFDHIHNNYYVFGGLIIVGSKSRDDWIHKYTAAEKSIRSNKGVSQDFEIKGYTATPAEKRKLFRSLNQCHKFAVIIDQRIVIANVWNNKKDKQRFLDFVYKLAVKKALEDLISRGYIEPSEVGNIIFNVDEHSTATSGIYELRESLEQELLRGTFNYNYLKHFPPILPKAQGVVLNYCNSAKNILIRAADIVSNRVFFEIGNGTIDSLASVPNMFITYWPPPDHKQ